ncbi:MAG: hypothetical protein ABSB70_02460 [Candidatus Velthaea sp.]|jgi:hypothetical protein
MTVEFFGMARVFAGASGLDIGGERLTKRELVRELAQRCPAMLGSVIDAGGESFVHPNLLLLDGRRATGDDEPFDASDRPCVLFLASGG